MISLILLLIGQNNGLGTQTVEATEILQRKPHFAYQLPAWVTDEYLFEKAGFSLAEEIEKCIDATILTNHLGGAPLNPGLVKARGELDRLRPDSAMRTLAQQLEFSPPPDIRRQVLTYRIIGDWQQNNLEGARQTLRTLKADKEASTGLDLEYIEDLLEYWDKDLTNSKDSLLIFLLVSRDPENALRFLSLQGDAGVLLKFHLDADVSTPPQGPGGDFLSIHRLVRSGKYSEALVAIDDVWDERSVFKPLLHYDKALALLGQGQSRMAHLAVPDSFAYQWLLPERALALARARVEWGEERVADARKWFKIASADPAYDLYSRWVMNDPAAQAAFTGQGADDLYQLLEVTEYLRSDDYAQAAPILQDLTNRLDVSSPDAVDEISLALYGSVNNEQGNYQLTLGIADVVRNLDGTSVGSESMGLGEESYFVTAAHLAVADAYYYAGGRYEELARPFYQYCTASGFDDLRFQGYFGLGWSYLSKRETAEAWPLISILKDEDLPVRESQILIFFEGLVLYSDRDFSGAAEVFRSLNFSRVPEMRMQGLYFEGRSYEQSGRPALAASAYDDLLNDFPAAEEVRDAWSRLARAQIESGLYDEAEKTLGRLVEQAKLHHFKFAEIYNEILLLIFDSAMSRGEEEQAREFAERLSHTQNTTLPLEAYYFRVSDKYTELWQVDRFKVEIERLSLVNSRSMYLPPLLLRLARMEIEVADYDSASAHLERILQWPELSDINDILPEVSFELIRARALDKDWEAVIQRSPVFVRSYSDLADYASRVLYFHAVALVNRAGNGDPFARKEDGQKALDLLDRLQSSYAKTEFVRDSGEDIELVRKSARLMVQ